MLQKLEIHNPDFCPVITIFKTKSIMVNDGLLFREYGMFEEVQ